MRKLLIDLKDAILQTERIYIIYVIDMFLCSTLYALFGKDPTSLITRIIVFFIIIQFGAYVIFWVISSIKKVFDGTPTKELLIHSIKHGILTIICTQIMIITYNIFN